MISRSNRIAITGVILLACHLNQVITLKWTEDGENTSSRDMVPNWEKDLKEYNQYSDINKESLTNIYKKKNLYTSHDSVKRINENGQLVPLYQTVLHECCSCELKYQWIDKGINYYPRYLQTGVCAPDCCGGHYRCSEKEYKVEVLRLIDYDSSEAPKRMFLPKALKKYFEPETVTVAVACQCVIDA